MIRKYWVTYRARVAVRGWPRGSLILEEVVLDDREVVEQLNAQVALGLDVVFHVDHAVHFDVDGEAIAGELC